MLQNYTIIVLLIITSILSLAQTPSMTGKITSDNLVQKNNEFIIPADGTGRITKSILFDENIEELSTPTMESLEIPDITRDQAITLAIQQAKTYWGLKPNVYSVIDIFDFNDRLVAYDIDLTLDGSTRNGYTNIATEWRQILKSQNDSHKRRNWIQRQNIESDVKSVDHNLARITISATFEQYPVLSSQRAVSNYYASGWVCSRIAKEVLGNENPELVAVYLTGPWERSYEFKVGNKSLIVEGYEPWRYYYFDQFMVGYNNLFAKRKNEVLEQLNTSGKDYNSILDEIKIQNKQAFNELINIDPMDNPLTTVYISGYDTFFERFEWHYGCSPTAGAMVLNYWENYSSYGKINYHFFSEYDDIEGDQDCHIASVQLGLNNYMNTDPATGGTLTDNIYPGMRDYANAQGYNFSGGPNWTGNIFNGWHWDEIVNDINTDLPFVWSLDWFPGTGGNWHSVAVVGYDDVSQNLQCYSTWSTNGDFIQSVYYKGGLFSRSYGASPIPGGTNNYDLKITSPDGGQIFAECNTNGILMGTATETITWDNHSNPGHHVDLYYSTDGGVNWIGIATNETDDGSFNWTVPNISTLKGRVLIRQYNNATDLASSDGSYGDFIIQPVTPFTISGYIRDENSNGIYGVTVTLSNGGGTTTTNSSGFYNKDVASGYSGIATPSLNGWTFSPNNIVYTNVTANQTNQDYIASLLDIDVALVIDRSGSMGTSGYMEPAKTAAKNFVALMVPGDKIGVVSFSSSAGVNFPLTTIISEATKTAAQNAISAITSGGATSIGAGMQSGQSQLNYGNTSVHQGMVLLSDGQENTSPYVNDVLPAIPENTDIYTIALGPNSDQLLLNNIASQTGGFYSFAPGVAELEFIYYAIKAQVSDQQIIATFSGLINPSQIVTHTVSVDGSITNATFAVTWPGSDLDLELIDPNGRIINPDTASVDPNIEFFSGATYEYYKVNSPLAGIWTVKIIAISIPRSSEAYNASVFGTAALKMDIYFSKNEYYNSEPILVTANINEVGDPIIDATVTADVTTPAIESTLSFRKSHNNSENGMSTPLSLVLENGMKKYYDDEGQLYYSITSMQLFDDGLHQDSLADDGIYANYFLNTEIEGSYTFNVHATGVSSTSGNFSREATKSTVVGPPAIPDFAANLLVYDTCSASQNLLFGTAFDATDCIDIVYDCYSPPPPPPSVLAAWFETCNENLLCDFRQTNDSSEIIWKVNFQQVTGCPVSFSWNPSELPTRGYFHLVDPINGQTIDINMRTQSSYTLINTAFTSLYIKYQIQNVIQLWVNINNGWNLVSVPGINPDGMGVDTWWAYRDPLANVFKYAGGYQPVTTTTPGIGYWMKHSGDRTYETGDEWPFNGIQIVPHNPINAASGWNLIGGYELIANTSGITTNPPGLWTGTVYKYLSGYQIATTIEPGIGYWTKLTAAGQIILPEGLLKSGGANEYFKEDWGKIILTDVTGINYTLYAVKGEVDLNQYELPPAPPEGMFDIRFSSGRIAENINSSVKEIDLSGVTYPLTVKAENMDMRIMDETGKIVNVNLKKGEDVVINNPTVQKLMVTGELIPDKYALEQNYPNPFNPSTVIEFSLPENVNSVRLTIYNVLGEKVAELVNSNLTAGRYQYQWNASNVATGMYIYELQTDKFVSIKKMVLIK